MGSRGLMVSFSWYHEKSHGLTVEFLILPKDFLMVKFFTAAHAHPERLSWSRGEFLMVP